MTECLCDEMRWGKYIGTVMKHQASVDFLKTHQKGDPLLLDCSGVQVTKTTDSEYAHKGEPL